MGIFRTRRIGRRDPKKEQGGIRVVWIGRDVTRDCRRGCLSSMLGQASVAVQYPFRDFAHGHGLAFQGILINPVLKRLLQPNLARHAITNNGEGLIDQCLENGGLWGRRSGRAAARIGATAALAKPATVRRLLGSRIVVHDAGPSKRGSRPVLADQRSIATST